MENLFLISTWMAVIGAGMIAGSLIWVILDMTNKIINIQALGVVTGFLLILVAGYFGKGNMITAKE